MFTAPPDTLRLRARLDDAQREHDVIRLAQCAGVHGSALDEDNRRWELIGGAIACLARLLGQHCAASAFCDASPDLTLVTQRMSESIDDLLDAPAWRVIDAAARLAVIEQGP